MNKEVNFEIAKLLKDKECVIKPLGLKNNTDYVEGYEWDYEDKNDTVKITEFQFEDHVCYFRYLKPTIAEVVMWLYEKHDIWIGVKLTDNTRNFYFQPTIWTSKDRDFHDEDMVDQAKSICKWKEWQYNSPTEAYEAAIIYTLENLIQNKSYEH